MSSKFIFSTPQQQKSYEPYDSSSKKSISGPNSVKMANKSHNQSITSPGQATTNPSSLQQSIMRDQQLSGDFSLNQSPPLFSQYSQPQNEKVGSDTNLRNSLNLSQKQSSNTQKAQATPFQPSTPPIISGFQRSSQNIKTSSIDMPVQNEQNLFPNSSSVYPSKITSPTQQPLLNLSPIHEINQKTPSSFSNSSTQKAVSPVERTPQYTEKKNYQQAPSQLDEAKQQEQPEQVKKSAPMNSSVHEAHHQKSNSNIQNNQGNKQNDSFCSTGSRRFSFFSKTSCATGVSQIYGTSLFRRSTQSVPRVNITNIIKKRAYLYLDEGLANTFDELLESGYNIVLNKKNERDELKQMEDTFKMELDYIQKEITPLYQELNKTQTQLEYYNEQYQKQIAEHQAMEMEILSLKDQINQRQLTILQEEQLLNEQIKDAEINNNNIKTDILLNKTTHKQDREQGERVLKQYKSDLDKITEYLSEQKSCCEDKKQDQASRLRKMENKSKMYLGILKH